MKYFNLLAALSLTAMHAASAASTDSVLKQTLHQAERIVNSLKLEKPSQMRVFAIDGTEYTNSEALWLKGRLTATREALDRNDSKMAAVNLQAAVDTLRSHGSSLTAPMMAGR